MKQLEEMKEFRRTKWTRGKLLKTRITSQWDQESFEKTNCYERARVFSNFSEEDQGRSRILVCTLNESHPDYELNGSIITTAPELEIRLQQSTDMLNALLALFGDHMALTTKFAVSQQIKENDNAINKALGL